MPSPRPASAPPRPRMPSCSAPWAGPASARADGTEIAPQLDLRFRLKLYAGVRPVRAIPGVPVALADPRAAGIDFVLIRESTEGLFHSSGKGSGDRGLRRGDAAHHPRDDREALPLRLPPGRAARGEARPEGSRHAGGQGQCLPRLRLHARRLRRRGARISRGGVGASLRRCHGARPGAPPLGLRRAADREHVRRHPLGPRRRAGGRHGLLAQRRYRRRARGLPAGAWHGARHRRARASPTRPRRCSRRR